MKYRLMGLIWKSSNEWATIEEHAKAILKATNSVSELDVYDADNKIVGTFKRSVEYVPAKAPNLPVTV